MDFGSKEYINLLTGKNKSIILLADMLRNLSDDDMFVSGILTLVDENEKDAKLLIEFMNSNTKATRSDIIYYASAIEQERHSGDPDYFDD